MLDKLIDKIDFKWWISLEAQQKLTVLMALMILGLSFIVGFLFLESEERINSVRAEMNLMRIEKNVEISKERAKAESCQAQSILYLQEKDRQFYELLTRQEEINRKLNENAYN